MNAAELVEHLAAYLNAKGSDIGVVNIGIGQLKEWEADLWVQCDDGQSLWLEVQRH